MRRFVLVGLALSLWGIEGQTSAQPPTAWRAGAATVKITPECSLGMAGYAGRKKPSEGVAQDLFAKALAIQDPCGNRAVLITLDLIGVSRSMRDWVVARLCEEHGLEPAAVLIGASHTHCGPSLGARPAGQGDARKPAEPAPTYLEWVQPKIVAVATEALGRLAPASLDYLRARAGFAMNRRRPTGSGFRNAPHIDGPVDHEVPVLRVSDADGKLLAVLFGYACHNTTMGDYLFRGDYAGYAQQYVEEAHPGAVALFLAGCGADQNPYPRGQEDLVKYHGRSLAMAVEAALQTVPRPLGGPLRVGLEEVTLEFAPPPPRDTLEQLAQGKDQRAKHAQRLLKQIEEKQVRSTHPYLVQVLRFGPDLTLVALAGEAVVDYALRLKRELAGPGVWVSGYCNDVFGYVPSLRVLKEGGYEAGGAMAYTSFPGAFAASIEERIVDKVLQMARTPIESRPIAVDLEIGQAATVPLADGRPATVKLVALEEKRDSLRQAVRQATVTVEVNGQQATLNSATYHLPITVGDVQIDCPITRGYNQGDDLWGLDAAARLRLWPAGYPWITPGTFVYPANQRWFASHTIMANQIGDGEQISKGLSQNPHSHVVRPSGTEPPTGSRTGSKKIYYHWGLDFGGAEGLVDVWAATDGQVVSVAGEALQPGEYPPQVKPRADVVYLRDARGWFYRYSHLDSIDAAITLGAQVRMGQKIGMLGKKGSSGGWSHLHFDIVAPQPSGRWGILEPYALVWEAYHREHPEEVLHAVARPHQLAAVGETVTLDGTRSWSRHGAPHITAHIWTLSSGKTLRGPTVTTRYSKPGTYSEILKVTDKDGNVDYDFAVVRVTDPQQPEQQRPSIHAAYWPTRGIRAGDEVTFKVRSFYVAPDEGEEEWDFGDRSPKVRVRSDGNAQQHAPDGYAVTTHRFAAAGHHLVRVSRTNHRGESATARLQVRVAQ